MTTTSITSTQDTEYLPINGRRGATPSLASQKTSTQAGTDSLSMESQTALLSLIATRVEQLMEHVLRLYERIGNVEGESPPAVSVEQAARLLGRQPFTVREWCRNGRMKAHRATARGPYAEWRIPMDSIRAYQANGLLPIAR